MKNTARFATFMLNLAVIVFWRSWHPKVVRRDDW